MRVYFLIWGTILLSYVQYYRVNANNKCYQAKICVHDGKEKCGRDGDGNIRRFLDSCDIREYNCLRGAGYTKVHYEECRDLPSIDKQVSKEVAKKNKNKDGTNLLKGEDSGTKNKTANMDGHETKKKLQEDLSSSKE